MTIEDTRNVHSGRGCGARLALKPTDLSDTFSWGAGAGTHELTEHSAVRTEEERRGPWQLKPLKGAGGVRPSLDVDTSAALSPDRCDVCGAGRDEVGRECEILV